MGSDDSHLKACFSQNIRSAVEFYRSENRKRIFNFGYGRRIEIVQLRQGLHLRNIIPTRRAIELIVFRKPKIGESHRAFGIKAIDMPKSTIGTPNETKEAKQMRDRLKGLLGFY